MPQTAKVLGLQPPVIKPIKLSNDSFKVKSQTYKNQNVSK
jgi:hypothetical protein